MIYIYYKMLKYYYELIQMGASYYVFTDMTNDFKEQLEKITGEKVILNDEDDKEIYKYQIETDKDIDNLFILNGYIYN